jgi:hypothetical protein
MGHVMVPVPQELEEQVQHYLTWRLSTGAMAGWTESALATLYGQLDESARVAFEMIARGVVDDDAVTVGRVAGRVGTTTREILGIVVELAHQLRALGGPSIPVIVIDPPDGGDDDQRPLAMPRDAARTLLSVAGRL